MSSTEPARLAVHRGRSTSTEALSLAVVCESQKVDYLWAYAAGA